MNRREEKDLKCGRMVHGFFTKTMCWQLVHNSLSVKIILMAYRMPVFEHLLYSSEAPHLTLVFKDDVCK